MAILEQPGIVSCDQDELVFAHVPLCRSFDDIFQTMATVALLRPTRASFIEKISLVRLVNECNQVMSETTRPSSTAPFVRSSARARLGIIGGYGPLTSALFCQRIVRHALCLRPERAPAFVMDSVPVSFADVHACIHGHIEATRTLVALANDSIQRLAILGATDIALPCNSLHALWDEFAVPDGMRLIHVAEPVVKRLMNRGHRRVGILGSALTCGHDVYFSRLRDAAIECVRPSPVLQARLNHELAAFVRSGEVRYAACEVFDDIAREFQTRQVDALLLACTDIATMLERGRFTLALPIEDSLDALAETCALHCLAPSEAPRSHGLR